VLDHGPDGSASHVLERVHVPGTGTGIPGYQAPIGLPTLFLVGKDGNVISRTIQVNDLEDAVQKGLE
jgi:hypothetical protein